MMVVNEVRKPFGFLADYEKQEVVGNVYQLNEEEMVEVAKMEQALHALVEENKRLNELVAMYQEALANLAVKMANNDKGVA